MSQSLDCVLELKSIDARQFQGHGSVFSNRDLGGDIVVPGAFRRSLARHKAEGTRPLMFWMHKPDHVPGVWEEIKEDEGGLFVRGELVDTQLGNEMRTLLKHKAVRGLSIGYRPVEVDYDVDGNRLLKEIDLWEVSIVSMAMNPLARVEAAKARLSASGEYVPTPREFEETLRQAGCSRSVAKMCISKMFGGTVGGMPTPRRDADDPDDEAAEVLRSIMQLQDRLGAHALKR